jgi:HSP20 family protein
MQLIGNERKTSRKSLWHEDRIFIFHQGTKSEITTNNSNLLNPMTMTTCTPTYANGFSPNRLFRLAETLLGEPRPATHSWSPRADVAETDTAYIVKADLPEVKIEDVKVSVREGILTVKGERNYSKNTETEKVHLQERSYGSFSRSFALPKDADAESVTADYKNGTLTVTVPKKPEVQPKEIEVRVN